MPEETDWRDQAKPYADEVKRLAAGLKRARDERDDEALDRFTEAVENDALSIEYRSGWTSVGESLTIDEFCITLCTGGPAVRIVGELSDGYPVQNRCRMEVSDWFKPWTQYGIGDDELSQAITEYANVFPWDAWMQR